jgi:hypothetical protein
VIRDSLPLPYNAFRDQFGPHVSEKLKGGFAVHEWLWMLLGCCCRLNGRRRMENVADVGGVPQRYIATHESQNDILSLTPTNLNLNQLSNLAKAVAGRHNN